MNAIHEASPSVVDVMQTDLYSLSPETPVSLALRIAIGNRVNHMLVIEDGMLAGILSREDLSWADETSPVRECMTSPVPCVGPETTIDDAAEIMSEQRLSCLAVVIDALLVGIITRSELVERARNLLENAAPADLSAVLYQTLGASDTGGCIACGRADGVHAVAHARHSRLCGDCTVKATFRLRAGNAHN